MKQPQLFRRGVVALATALTLVALMSSPASAATAQITSGTINIGTESFTVGGGGPADKCFLDSNGDGDTTDPGEFDNRLGTQSINVTFSGNASSGTWTATGSWKSRFRLAAPNDGTYWQADMSLLTGAGAYSGTAPNYTLTSTGTHITIEAKIYQLTPPGCLKDTLVCTVRARVVLTAGASFTGSLPTPVAGDTAKLIGTSNTTGGVPVTVVGSGCPATITSQLVGKHVSLPSPNGLSLTF